ncbi:MAG: CDP-diacylglycerol--glycerol-3-phosphate 3-phosphatidyltransferase [Pseudomonadota bacterium]
MARIWTIPNILTAARILAAPGLVVVFLLLERPVAEPLGVTLFVLAALTDFIDGWVARRFGMASAVGKMLDPIADKAMAIVALMLLVALHATPVAGGGLALAWELTLPATAIVLREVLVAGLREYLGDVKLAVTPLAKWKTTAQLVAIGVLLAALPGAGGAVFGASLYHAGIVLLWIAAALTLASGWDYFRKGLAHIHAREE